MELAQLKLAWSEFHDKVDQYELEKEDELRQKYPELDEDNLHNRLKRAIDRKFRQEARELLSIHLVITNPRVAESDSILDNFKY